MARLCAHLRHAGQRFAVDAVQHPAPERPCDALGPGAVDAAQHGGIRDVQRRQIRLVDAETCRVRATIPTAYPTGWDAPAWTFSPDTRTLAVTYGKGIDKGEDSIGRPLVVDLW